MITLVHPSRGRPEQAQAALQIWQDWANAETRHVLSLDSDDPKLAEYQDLFADSEILVNDNQTMVEALNRCLPCLSADDALITLFDDMTPSPQWGSQFAAMIQPDKLLQINCGVALQTVCAGAASVFMRWGYIYYPGYVSMYADNDYQEHGQREGLFIQSDIEIEHHHPAHGTGTEDPTYWRQNHQAAYRIGKMILDRRRLCAFAY
jgi:hypothetical protein